MKRFFENFNKNVHSDIFDRSNSRKFRKLMMNDDGVKCVIRDRDACVCANVTVNCVAIVSWRNTTRCCNKIHMTKRPRILIRLPDRASLI